MERLRKAWLGVPFSLACALFLGATQASQPLVFRADVALVAIPVFVTDKSGQPVRGLTQEDFEVEEGGRKVPIVAFHAVDIDAPPSPSAVAALPAAVRAVSSRRFLLLLDLEFSPPQGVLIGRKAAAAFIRDSFAPGDLVAVAVSAPAGLRVLTNFTTDHAQAARAIVELKPQGSLGSDPLGTAEEFISSGNANLDEWLRSLDVVKQEDQQRQYANRVTGFVADLSKLIGLLAPLRGRKQIVLLSGGFAESAWTPVPRGPAEADVNFDLMQKAFRAARESDVVIHTISLKGMEGLPGNFLERQTVPENQQGSAGTWAGRGEGRDTLASIALSSGGRFILPTNNFGQALREMDRISRHSYVIAFEAPPSSGNGDSPRTLRVRTRRSGLSVSHRTVYSIPGSTQSLPPMALSSAEANLIAKSRSGGDLPLQLATLPYQDREGKSVVHAVLHIDGSSLLTAEWAASLPVQVHGYLMRDGRVLDTVAFETSIDPSRGEMARKSGIYIVTAFPADQGAAEVRFFVRAGSAGITGFASATFMIPLFQADQPLVSAPMFTRETVDRVVLPFQPAGRPRIEIPFRLGSTRFVPDPQAKLSVGWTREACVFVWRGAQASSSPFDITADLRRAGDSPRPLRIEGLPRIVKDTDGFDRYVVSVTPLDTPHGVYTLRMSFRDPTSGTVSFTETRVLMEK